MGEGRGGGEGEERERRGGDIDEGWKGVGRGNDWSGREEGEERVGAGEVLRKRQEGAGVRRKGASGEGGGRSVLMSVGEQKEGGTVPDEGRGGEGGEFRRDEGGVGRGP